MCIRDRFQSRLKLRESENPNDNDIMCKALENCVKALRHLGVGITRGMGEVTCSLEECSTEMQEALSKDMSNNLPDNMLNNLPDNMLNNLSDDMSNNLSDDMSNNLPDNMPNNLSEDMSNNLPRCV